MYVITLFITIFTTFVRVKLHLSIFINNKRKLDVIVIKKLILFLMEFKLN